MCQILLSMASFYQAQLNTNMRVHLHGDRRAEIFSERLLLLGNGKMVPDPDGQITMKDIGTVVDTEELINKSFPTYNNTLGTTNGYVKERSLPQRMMLWDRSTQPSSTRFLEPFKCTNLSILFLIPPKQSSIL